MLAAHAGAARRKGGRQAGLGATSPVSLHSRVGVFVGTSFDRCLPAARRQKSEGYSWFEPELEAAALDNDTNTSKIGLLARLVCGRSALRALA